MFRMRAMLNVSQNQQTQAQMGRNSISNEKLGGGTEATEITGALPGKKNPYKDWGAAMTPWTSIMLEQTRYQRKKVPLADM